MSDSDIDVFGTSPEADVDSLSSIQRELLQGFSEVYTGEEDNFTDALEYACEAVEWESVAGFDDFEDFWIPMKNYWREFEWMLVASVLHTAPNVDEPAVDLEDSVETTVLRSLQQWSGEVRSSFYSHSASWVAGDTGVNQNIVNRVFEKVQGQLFAYDRTDPVYYVCSVRVDEVSDPTESMVNSGGGVGRVVWDSKEQAAAQARESAEASESVPSRFELVVLEVFPSEDTLLLPFDWFDQSSSDSDRFVLSRWGDVSPSVVLSYDELDI